MGFLLTRASTCRSSPNAGFSTAPCRIRRCERALEPMSAPAAASSTVSMLRDAWPATRAARDLFVLSTRVAKPTHSPWEYQDIAVEDERAADGTIARSATVFLTGRECPWRC